MRTHRATYARDRRKGGYIVRVEGPHADRFAGRRVPVTLRSGEENDEELSQLLWSGIGSSGEKIALYTFTPHPRDEEEDEIPF